MPKVCLEQGRRWILTAQWHKVVGGLEISVAPNGLLERSRTVAWIDARVTDMTIMGG
jgi:hypothetical protein